MNVLNHKIHTAFYKGLWFYYSVEDENLSYENSFSCLWTNDVETDNELSFASVSNIKTSFISFKSQTSLLNFVTRKSVGSISHINATNNEL